MHSGLMCIAFCLCVFRASVCDWTKIQTGPKVTRPKVNLAKLSVWWCGGGTVVLLSQMVPDPLNDLNKGRWAHYNIELHFYKQKTTLSYNFYLVKAMPVV